ncbi:MAG: DUF559 domain-containing protein [Rhodospirillales bacterium]
MREGEKTKLARRLRQRGTDAEARLWRPLRRRGLGGGKFRRQHPLGPYVADFVCLQARLVIELDGGQHGDAETVSARTRLLQARGFRVLRFWNGDVLRQPEAVLAAIAAALA